jgi:hypothetical protein
MFLDPGFRITTNLCYLIINIFLNRENLARILSANNGKLSLESIFKLLDAELANAYGHKVNWEEVINPSGKPDEYGNLKRDAYHYVIDASMAHGIVQATSRIADDVIDYLIRSSHNEIAAKE